MWLHYFLIVYILVLGLTLGLGRQIKQKNIVYLTLTFGLFTLLAALRSSIVGNDTDVYISLFNSISLTGDVSNFFWRYEKGYLYLNKLLSLITTNPQIIIIISSIIIMYGSARYIYKYSQIPWLSVFLFFTLGYYGMSMNTIRLNIAIVIVLLSYDFLRERRLVKFVITVILASLFHRTAIVFLLAWPITKLKFNFKTACILILLSMGLFISFPIILQVALNIFPTYQYYVGSDYLNGEIRLASVMNLLVGLSIVLLGIFTNFHKESEAKNPFNIGRFEKINDGKIMLLLLVSGVLVTFISFNFNLLDRVGDFFLVFSCVYLPNAINKIYDGKLKVLIIFVVVILFILYSTTIQILRPEWNTIYPYEFFWSTNIN
ncbi:EpsG family protein [Ureibacillus chungkukjangi]|uniref:EpsG-like putative glucosyltransferase n=1 Tax=Ureibacillus chungkukjangi TaxID=1202712 RepID=A0A318TF45_9BACL|nr:EpsG family protein [Ureibacillus chungkukjangi]PYF03256.1 EpsG-like putative glucosyltransferase [Ureibacillus chungkukjangi]